MQLKKQLKDQSHLKRNLLSLFGIGILLSFLCLFFENCSESAISLPSKKPPVVQEEPPPPDVEPQITGQPEAVTTYKNLPVAFKVKATPATSYQWKLNGADISGETTDSLLLTSARLEDSGDYTVVVINGDAQTESDPASLYIYPENCNEIKTALPASVSGLFKIDLDEQGPLNPIDAECDMTTEGGGWMLVLNYLHLANATPTLQARTTELPIKGQDTFNTNEPGTKFWGHTAPSLLNQINFSEMQFYCKSSGHARVMNFTTTSANCISYFKAGTGSCNGLKGLYQAISGHNANLPASMNDFFNNQMTSAMTSFPFFTQANYHWAIAGNSNNNNRWECDDSPNGPQNNTLHRIWVR